VLLGAIRSMKLTEESCFRLVVRKLTMSNEASHTGTWTPPHFIGESQFRHVYQRGSLDQPWFPGKDPPVRACQFPYIFFVLSVSCANNLHLRASLT
jgi:hypothetical protein